MEKIASFCIDHLILNPGIYVSRKDRAGENVITTIDIRVKKPNYEDCMSPAEAHVIEHIGATYFRNITGFSSKVIYFGPMGCLTGFYLVLADDYEAGTEKYGKLVSLILEMFKSVVTWNGGIPGATKKECGNYKMMDLEGAKNVSGNMLVLGEDFNALEFTYPEDGKGIYEDYTVYDENLKFAKKSGTPDMSEYIGEKKNAYMEIAKDNHIKEQEKKEFRKSFIEKDSYSDTKKDSLKIKKVPKKKRKSIDDSLIGYSDGSEHLKMNETEYEYLKKVNKPIVFKQNQLF